MDLEIDDLGKQYGQHWALREFSVKLEAGLVGLVGPNGAGKTTLMRLIASLIPASQGRICWNGQELSRHGRELRQVLGYLPQEFGVYPDFTARQFLEYLATMKGLAKAARHLRVKQVLELVNLEEVADRKLKTFSGGMKQRVGIAQALLNDPLLLIVDEPTVGLDPAERVHFRTLLSSLTAQRLVILSTHIIADIEAVAGRLLILNRGRLLADTTPETLLAEALGQVWTITTNQDTAKALQSSHQVSAMVAQPGGKLQLRLIGASCPHPQAQAVEPGLEEAYLLKVNKTDGSITN